jgi:hypothetical protein
MISYKNRDQVVWYGSTSLTTYMKGWIMTFWGPKANEIMGTPQMELNELFSNAKYYSHLKKIYTGIYIFANLLAVFLKLDGP